MGCPPGVKVVSGSVWMSMNKINVNVPNASPLTSDNIHEYSVLLT